MLDWDAVKDYIGNYGHERHSAWSVQCARGSFGLLPTKQVDATDSKPAETR